MKPRISLVPSAHIVAAILVLGAHVVLRAQAPAAGPRTREEIDKLVRELSQQANASAPVPPGLQKKLDVLAPNSTVSDQKTLAIPEARALSNALGKARSRLKGNDPAGAEEYLTASNPFEPNTAYWSLDAARAWLLLADELSKESDRAGIAAAVARTLELLTVAYGQARQAGLGRMQASAKTAEAVVHERYRGDPNAAIASYRAALALQPDDLMTQETLGRLERSLAILQARGKTGAR